MSEEGRKFRLVTRSDMDGLVCAILLKQKGLIDIITFVHPKDVQDGKILLTENDITTNLPYNENVHLAFDHHASEMTRIQGDRPNRVIDPEAPSAARVVYEFYGGKAAFPAIPDNMMHAVDKADSAGFSKEDILNPRGWELLSFIMDARTGLGRFRDFRVSNYQLMMDLIDYCLKHSIDDILNLPDVKERTDLYFAHHDPACEQIQRCTSVYGDLAVLDLRNEEVIYATNRFMIYALFPDCRVSMHVLWGLKKQNTAFAVGKSVINRGSALNIGELMLEYGGGGHANAGTCQIDNARAEKVKAELIERISGVRP